MNYKALAVLFTLCVVVPGMVSTTAASLGALLGSTLLVWLVQTTSPPRHLRTDRPRRALLHDKFSEEKLPAEIDAIVIGSGMGGLSCAALLARAGKRVIVLEQHPDVCGGCTHEFSLGGYKFDSGLHYTVPWNGPLLQLTGFKKQKDVPQFELLGDGTGTFDNVYIGDAPAFPIKHKEGHLGELRRMFPDEQKAIDEYLKLSDYGIRVTQVCVFARLLPKWLQGLYWRLIPEAWLAPMRKTAKDVLDSLTDNKKLKSLLCGLWIDSGSRPDVATFMMEAAVFRGLPQEGGCYPRGGSETLAECLVAVIDEWGGRVLIDAKVGQINYNDKLEACGVTLMDGTSISSEIVVSAAGYHNTFDRLSPDSVLRKYSIPKKLVPDSAGFVMANIGMKGSPSDLGITNTNTWYLPATADGDIFPCIVDFYNDPNESKVDPPLMFTFPSVKDQSAGDDKTSCQILLYMDSTPFADWKEQPSGARGSDYTDLKKVWEDKLTKLLYRFYPKTEGRIDFFDLSTPLSIAHYLNSVGGASVGLDVVPDRFFKPEIRKHLDPVTAVPNLYLTGHDTTLPGVVMAQIAGVITAFRIVGFVQSARFLLQSIFFLD
ncbi:Prolycopene isomerase [Diplonema papillatum]|nr:Prolycopene isomerase [Diplonema papillatum]|eukprot:gene14649-22405_t